MLVKPQAVEPTATLGHTVNQDTTYGLETENLEVGAKLTNSQ